MSAGRGALSGTFEQDRVAAITSMVRPGDVVWDIGAHKGYITLAAATRVGKKGHVYAIEPAPPNLEMLERHIAWNNLTNVDIVRCAVSGEDGRARFGGPGSSITYRLGRGDYEVEVQRISSLLRNGLRAPSVLKIDVEGNEFEVLRGGSVALRSDALLFVAIHSYAQYQACTGMLNEAGWRVVNSRAISAILAQEPVQWEADPDILAIGPDRTVDEAALAAFRG